MSVTATPSPEPLRLADHPALDLLNTVMTVEGQATDLLRTDEDAARWLRQAVPSPGQGGGTAVPAAAGLLGELRSLREVVRDLVRQLKNGVAADPADLNGFLREASAHAHLVPEPDGGFRLERRSHPKTARQWLAPLAEEAAQLLAEGDFGLVRQCEHPECTLWFYDRTKAHRRRWCSMAVCGNRAKVAAFRKRQR